MRNISEQPTEKLKEHLTLIKLINGALSVVFAFILLLCIYVFVMKDYHITFILFFIFPMSISPLILMNIGYMQIVKKELSRR